MSKIIVIGSDGQLGQCLQVVATRRGITNILFASEATANILDTSAIDGLFALERPAFVINCAAYTAVDQAEEEIDRAAAINHTGAAILATACKVHNVTLIHISTDFVFAGNMVKLLTEDDDTVPISVYGQTKLDGEVSIASILEKYYIIRTSWLYSEYANNFVKTMLTLAETRKELNIIADQVGTPTYAIDLAAAIYTIIDSNKQSYGVYHYSNEGVTSWFDFAKAIFELNDTDVKLNPIPGASYPTKAKRPAFSVMDKSKVKQVFGLEIPYWRESLVRCIAVLKGKEVES